MAVSRCSRLEISKTVTHLDNKAKRGTGNVLKVERQNLNIQVYLKLMSAKRVAKVLLVSVADFVSFSFVEHNNNNNNKDDKDCSRIPLLGRAPL